MRFSDKNKKLYRFEKNKILKFSDFSGAEVNLFRVFSDLIDFLMIFDDLNENPLQNWKTRNRFTSAPEKSEKIKK